MFREQFYYLPCFWRTEEGKLRCRTDNSMTASNPPLAYHLDYEVKQNSNIFQFLAEGCISFQWFPMKCLAH